MAKKKSKIKKFLKGAALAGAAALGAKALARNRSIADNEAKEFGFGQMKLKDYGPYSIGNNFKPKKQMTFPAGDYSRIEDYMPAYKKGGRVGCGVAKKGFGRALKKGRKK